MGMFDYFNVEIPLPDLWVPGEGVLQTKSLDCSLNTYRLTRSGQLIADKIMYEPVPIEERRYPDGPLSIIGCIRTKVLEKDVLQLFDGWVHFYGHDQQKNWHEYSAFFTKGQLVFLIHREQS